MWKSVNIPAEGVIGLECSGRISAEELEGMQAWLEREMANRDKPELVLFVGGFEGYDDLAAFWSDLKFDTRHVNDFARVAMIGEKEWIEWSTKAADLVTDVDLEWFDSADRSAAIAWASGVS